MKAIKLGFLALLLVLSSSFVASSAPASARTPNGLIAFIRNDQAFVLDVARGLRYPLVNSQRVVRLEIAPHGGAVVFFVRIHPAKSADDDSSALRGFISLPPYKKAFALPAPLGQIPFYSNLRWHQGGRKITISTDDFPKRILEYDLKTKRVTQIKNQFAVSSSDGRYEVFQRGKSIFRRDKRNGQVENVFDYGHPEQLLRVLGFQTELDWRNASNWWLGDPQISSDGMEVYFITNAASASSAAGGNSSLELVAAVNMRTRVPRGCYYEIILSPLSEDFCSSETKRMIQTRAPRILKFCEGCKGASFSLSPDGRHFLFAYASHTSAADNSWYGKLDSLGSKRNFEIINGVPEDAGGANLVSGWAWSPDSRFIAIGASYYNPTFADFDHLNWNIYLRDTRTGQAIKAIPNAESVSWGIKP
jgi:hypothetical protein